jgi:hypothetical protein
MVGRDNLGIEVVNRVMGVTASDQSWILLSSMAYRKLLPEVAIGDGCLIRRVGHQPITFDQKFSGDFWQDLCIDTYGFFASQCVSED